MLVYESKETRKKALREKHSKMKKEKFCAL